MIIVFDDASTMEGDYQNLLDVAFRTAKLWLSIIKVYICPYSKCADILDVFGVLRRDLPHAVIHDTVNDRKYVQPPAAGESFPRHGAGSVSITTDTLNAFLSESLGHSPAALSKHDDVGNHPTDHQGTIDPQVDSSSNIDANFGTKTEENEENILLSSSDVEGILQLNRKGGVNDMNRRFLPGANEL